MRLLGRVFILVLALALIFREWEHSHQAEHQEKMLGYWKDEAQTWKAYSDRLAREGAELLTAARDSGAFPDAPCAGSIDYQAPSATGISVCSQQDGPCSGPAPCTVCRAAPLGVCIAGRWYRVR